MFVWKTIKIVGRIYIPGPVTPVARLPTPPLSYFIVRNVEEVFPAPQEVWLHFVEDWLVSFSLKAEVRNL